MSSRKFTWSRWALILVMYLLLAGAGLLWSWVRGDASVWRLSTVPEPRFWPGLMAGTAIGLLIALWSRVAVRRFAWARELDREFRARLPPLTGLEGAGLALVSSVGEEIFFRGALMPSLGVWLSSALFALPHIGPGRQFLPWTAAAFVAGLLFGHLFAWSGDLTGPVVAHFTINFLNLRHLARRTAGGPVSAETGRLL